MNAFAGRVPEDKVLILLFGSDSCMPCKAIAGKLDAWQEDHPGAVTGYVDTGMYPETASQSGIFTVPAVIVYADGKPCLRKAGYFSVEELLADTERILEIYSHAG